jgi:hypothetical protein
MKPLMERLHILIEMLADATPEVAALRAISYSGNIEIYLLVILLHHLIFHKLLGYIISSRNSRFLYSWLDASVSRNRLLPRILIRLDPALTFEY